MEPPEGGAAAGGGPSGGGVAGCGGEPGEVALAGAAGMAVLLGDGNGGLQAAGKLAFAPDSIAAADFNLDGNLDLAVSTGNPSLEVFLGDGTGAFPTMVPVNAASAPRAGSGAAAAAGVGAVKLDTSLKWKLAGMVRAVWRCRSLIDFP